MASTTAIISSMLAAVTVILGLRASFCIGAPAPLARYRRWWSDSLALCGQRRELALVPVVQVVLVPGLALVVAAGGGPMALTGMVGAAIVPPVLLRRLVAHRERVLADQLDGMLLSLANALSTTPNLGEALRSLLDHVESPMRDEIATTLNEVELGRPLDEAMERMAGRLSGPGAQPAISAALLGRRTGGDLPAILSRMAATLREMNRLEGVVRSKTAEGRSQAWVMGMMPPLLIVALEKLDPQWLAPLWNDPFGWVLLASAVVLEVVAVALIRRIMAVNI